MMINGKTLEQITQELATPFDPVDIEWRVGSTNQAKTKGIALAYVTNRAIMNRLDSVVGAFNWQNTYKEWKGNSQLCGIGIRFGDEWVWKWDGADDSNTEAIKGGLSDSMKRAGYQWGIGRYLYNLENVWADLEPMGRSYKLKATPKLPSWALPKGYSYQGQSNGSQTAQNKPTGAATGNNTNTTAQTTSSTSKMTDKQRERWGVITVLKKKGKSDAEAQAWIDAQKAKGRGYVEMMQLIKQAEEKGAK